MGGGRREAAVVRGSSRDGGVGGDGEEGKGKRGKEPSEPRSEVSVQWTGALSFPLFLSLPPRLCRGYVGCRATR